MRPGLQVDVALLVRAYDKFRHLEVGAPVINRHEYGHAPPSRRWIAPGCAARAHGSCMPLGGPLLEHGAYPLVAGFCLDDESLGKVQQGQDRRLNERCLKSLEGGLGLRGPHVDGVLLQEVGEGPGDDAVTTDELAVVPREIEETSQLLCICRRLPCLDIFNLGSISGDAIGADDVPQVVEAPHGEGAFGDLELPFVFEQEL